MGTNEKNSLKKQSTQEARPGLNLDELKQRTRAQLDRRQVLYSEYFQDYKDEEKRRMQQKRWLRWLFFGIVMSFFVGLLFVSFSTIRYALNEKNNASDIKTAVAILGAIGTLITSVLVLPETIAQSLFPAEEKSSIDLFTTMVTEDRQSPSQADKDNTAKGE